MERVFPIFPYIFASFIVSRHWEDSCASKELYRERDSALKQRPTCTQSRTSLRVLRCPWVKCTSLPLSTLRSTANGGREVSRIESDGGVSPSFFNTGGGLFPAPLSTIGVTVTNLRQAAWASSDLPAVCRVLSVSAALAAASSVEPSWVHNPLDRRSCVPASPVWAIIFVTWSQTLSLCVLCNFTPVACPPLFCLQIHSWWPLRTNRKYCPQFASTMTRKALRVRTVMRCPRTTVLLLCQTTATSDLSWSWATRGAGILGTCGRWRLFPVIWGWGSFFLKRIKDGVWSPEVSTRPDRIETEAILKIALPNAILRNAHNAFVKSWCYERICNFFLC